MNPSKTIQPIDAIGILGHIGQKNLGDESIFSAVIENLRNRMPQARIYGFTINPTDTFERHGIRSFPIRRIPKSETSEGSEEPSMGKEIHESRPFPVYYDRFKCWLKAKPRLFSFLSAVKTGIGFLGQIPEEIAFIIESFKNIKGVNILIIAGSQQLIDYVANGPWSQPYALLKWTLLAKAAGAKVVYLSVGAGPINTFLGRVFIKKALSLASFRSYRDETSREWIQQLKLGEEIHICPDLAFSSSRISNFSSTGPHTADQPIVGINPVPIYDPKYWIGGGQSAYNDYIQKLSRFATWLIRRGYKIHLFPTQLNLDPSVIVDIRRMMEQETGLDLDAQIVDMPILNLEELSTAISRMKFVVASRYHAGVLSYALEKPILGIAYQPKTADLMRQMDQSDFVLNIQDFDLAEMKNKFEALERCENEAKAKILHKMLLYQTILAKQYNTVLYSL